MTLIIHTKHINISEGQLEHILNSIFEGRGHQLPIARIKEQLRNHERVTIIDQEPGGPGRVTTTFDLVKAEQ